MKKLLLLLLFIPLVAIGQSISVSNILKVAKMDRESFEIYAMDKVFVFNEFEEDEDFKGLRIIEIGNENKSLEIERKIYLSKTNHIVF